MKLFLPQLINTHNISFHEFGNIFYKLNLLIILFNPKFHIFCDRKGNIINNNEDSDPMKNLKPNEKKQAKNEVKITQAINLLSIWDELISFENTGKNEL